MSKITYANKVALNENSNIADINKVKADDMNEIKTCVNNNDDMLTGGAVAGDMVVDSIRTKNMFDKGNIIDNSYVSIGYAKVDNSVTAKCVYAKIEGGKTYTISKALSSRFAIGVATTIPKINTPLTNLYQDNSATSLTVTTNSNAQYLVAYVYNQPTDTLTFQQILNSIQVEEGSEATAYSPYQNLNGVSQPKIIWSGEKYNYNDTISLYEPLEVGHLYAFTCRGVSSTYNVTLMYLFTGNTIQIAYANNGGDSYEGFRYRLTTSNNNQTLTIGESGQSQKLGINTAILRIDKII